MRNGSDANTVPASVRCRPSTRMSFSWNGSTAQTDPACSAAASARDKRVGRKNLWRGETRIRGLSVQAQEAGHVVVESERHHNEHDRHSASLQPLEPLLG